MNEYVWFLIASVIIASFSQILLKKSAKKKYPSIIKEYLNPLVIIGYFMMLASTITTIVAYKGGVDYKNGPVIESLSYILVMFLSWAFFKEKLTVRKIVGNALILIGIAVFYL